MIKTASFNVVGSPVIDTVREQINIPRHGYNTGDKILYKSGGGTDVPGLANGLTYYVYKSDDDSIKLAVSEEDARAVPPVLINITGVGAGIDHSFTRIIDQALNICTNYNFRMEDMPYDLKDKCKLSLTHFIWAEKEPNYDVKGIGGVYCKSLTPIDTYNSQGYYKGNLLLPAYFGQDITYRNTDLEQTSIPIANVKQLLSNGLDIFIDTKKINQALQDIKGNIDNDPFSLTLVIYEIDEFDYVSYDMDPKVRNYPNVRVP